MFQSAAPGWRTRPALPSGAMEVRPYADADADAVARALARAFHDDPVYVALYPDARRRPRRLYHTMRGALGAAIPEAVLTTTAGAPVGVAAFSPPGLDAMSPIRLVGSLARHGWALGWAGLRRSLVIAGELDDHRPRAPHWHLFLLGVDPEWQRRGIGTELLAGTLAEATARGEACYLETTRERNVGFYARHGFAVRERFELLGGRGPTVWTMMRAVA